MNNVELARRLGFTSRSETGKLLRSIKKMPEGEANELMLAILSRFPFVNEGLHHPVDDLGLTMTGKERKLLMALYDNQGDVVSKNRVMDYLYPHLTIDRQPDIRGINSLIYRLRKKLHEKKLDFVIETVRGQGVVLHTQVKV